MRTHRNSNTENPKQKNHDRVEFILGENGTVAPHEVYEFTLS